MTERVTINSNTGVYEVRLDRPDKLNAFDPPMFRGLLDAGHRLADSPDARVVVLSGSGRAFSAGLDTAVLRALAAGDDVAGLDELTDADGAAVHPGQLAAWQWQRLPIPVIAAVHGVAFGAGFQVALGADVLLVAPDAELAVREVRWGLTPDMGATQLLPRLVGLQQAKELIWTGRTVTGSEAVDMGLALRAVEDPRSAALELATALARLSPDALRAGKYLVNAGLEESYVDGFARERYAIKALARSPNQVEAVAAQVEKRPPVFGEACVAYARSLN